MAAKKMGALALAGATFGGAIVPAMAPLAAGAQSTPDSVSAGSSVNATVPGLCVSDTTPGCLTNAELAFLSLVAGVLNGLATMAAP